MRCERSVRRRRNRLGKRCESRTSQLRSRRRSSTKSAPGRIVEDAAPSCRRRTLDGTATRRGDAKKGSGRTIVLPDPDCPARDRAAWIERVRGSLPERPAAMKFFETQHACRRRAAIPRRRDWPRISRRREPILRGSEAGRNWSSASVGRVARAEPDIAARRAPAALDGLLTRIAMARSLEDRRDVSMRVVGRRRTRHDQRGKGLKQIPTKRDREIVDEVIATNPAIVAEFPPARRRSSTRRWQAMGRRTARRARGSTSRSSAG